MNKIRLFLRQYFDMSQREINGTFVLCLLLLLFILAPIVADYVLPNPPINVRDKQVLDSLTLVFEQNKNSSTNIEKIKSKTLTNINVASFHSLKNIGLPEYLCHRIINYRTKAGLFKTSDDLKKIYGISLEDVTKLKSNFIVLDTTPKTKNPTTTTPKSIQSSNIKIEKQKFDINKADSNQLESIRGIGFKLANRIIKFRDKLGGFVHVSQLYEVYGLDSNVVQEIQKHVYIEAAFVPTKVHVNTCTFEELKNHPYIGFKIAKVVKSYIQQHGPLQSIVQFRQIKVIDNEKCKKLIPYLSFN